MELRKLSINDLDLLVKLRMDFLMDEQCYFSEDELIDMKLKCREFFISVLESNRFIAFVAEEDKEVLSTAFLTIQAKPPRKANIPFRIGTVYNVLTYKEYRRTGVATQVLTALLNEARSMGIKTVDLWATEDGEELYEKLGFWKVNCAPMKIDL